MNIHEPQLAAWENAVSQFVAAYRRIPATERTVSIAGGWSAREILQHLLEDEILFSTRVRAAIADPGSTIVPLDAERYQANLSYDLVSDEVLLDALEALRSVNIGLLRGLPDDAWDRAVSHPEAGDQTVELIGVMFGDHVSDHLRDLESARSSSATR